MIIDNLIREQKELNSEALNGWVEHFGLTSAKAAEILLANPRSLESWRAGRYKIPQFLVFAMRFAEQKLLKNKDLKTNRKKAEKSENNA